MAPPIQQWVSRIGHLVLVPIVLHVAATTPAASALQAVPEGGRLTPFSDRGLASFGDRQLEGFGRRGLTTFSDIPLAPMGGVEVPGPSARRSDRSRSSRSLTRAPRIVGPVSTSGASSATVNTDSVASIHGVTLPPVVATPMVVLPPVVAPELPIDPRPALAKLEQSLQGELARARSRGDSDLVRTLAANLQR